MAPKKNKAKIADKVVAEAKPVEITTTPATSRTAATVTVAPITVIVTPTISSATLPVSAPTVANPKVSSATSAVTPPVLSSPPTVGTLDSVIELLTKSNEFLNATINGPSMQEMWLEEIDLHIKDGLKLLALRLTAMLNHFKGSDIISEEKRLEALTREDKRNSKVNINNNNGKGKEPANIGGSKLHMFMAISGFLVGFAIGFIKELYKQIKAYLGIIKNVFKPLYQNLTNSKISGHITAISNSIKGVFSSITANSKNLIGGISKRFGGASGTIGTHITSMTNSIRGVFSSITANSKNLIGGISKRFGGASGAINTQITSMTNSIRGVFTNMGTHFTAAKSWLASSTAGIREMGTKYRKDLNRTLKKAKKTTAGKQVFGAIKESKIGKFLGIGAKTTKRAKGGAKSIGIMGNIMSKLQPFIGTFKSFLSFGKLIGTLLGKLFLPITIIMGIWDGITGAMKGYKTGGIMGAIKGAIIGVINGLVGFIWDGLMWVVKSILKAFGFGKIAKWLDQFNFKAILGWVFDLFSLLLIGPRMIIGAIKGMFKGMMAGWKKEGILGAVKGLFSGLIIGVFNAIKGIFVGILKLFGFAGLAKWVDKFNIKKILGPLFVIIDLLLTFPRAIIAGIKGAFKGMMSGYKTGGIWGAIKGLFTGMITGFWGSIKKTFMGFWNLLKSIDFKMIGNLLIAAFKGIFSAIFAVFKFILVQLPKFLLKVIWEILKFLVWTLPIAILKGILEVIKFIFISLPMMIIKGLGDLIIWVFKQLPWLIRKALSWIPGMGEATPPEEAKSEATSETKSEAKLASLSEDDDAGDTNNTNDLREEPSAPNIVKLNPTQIIPVQTNSSGAQIDQISRENTKMNSAAPITINPSSGGGGGTTSNNTSNVSTVTYQNNNIPDRQYNWTMGAVNAF